jgi:hypothetical protein
VLRQVWVFLETGDVEKLAEALSPDAAPRLLRGRFCRGEAGNHANPLQTAEARPGEHRFHLVLPAPNARLVTHPVPGGPYAGWSTLDELRSDVLTFVVPEPDENGLAPGQIRAATHYRTGEAKVVKSPAFVRWVNASLKRIEQLCPESERPWLRVAPGAAAKAKSGLRLQYLWREVGLEPGAAQQARTGPGAGAPAKGEAVSSIKIDVD